MIAEGRPWVTIMGRITITSAATTTEVEMVTMAGTATTVSKVTEAGKVTGAEDRWTMGTALTVAPIARGPAAGIKVKGSPRNTVSVST